MQNPYTGHFLKAFEYLLEQGAVSNQTEFLRSLALHPNTIAAYKAGRRNVTIPQLHQLYTKYHVKLHYLFTGKGEIMGKQAEEPTPAQRAETEKELAVERARNAVLEKLVEAKEAEIRYLREILKLKVENLGEGDSSNG